MKQQDGRLILEGFSYSGLEDVSATATMRIAIIREEAGMGVGTVDAAFNAVMKLLNRMGEKDELTVAECHINSVGIGSDAAAKADVTLLRVGSDDRFTGSATHVDINRAAAEAVIEAVNNARGFTSHE